jgi:DNA-binding beta-propeller fold protein YncE
MRTLLVCVWGLTMVFVYHPALLPGQKAAPAQHVETHRSPIDLAILPGGQGALTVNHTSDSVSLVDLREGKVLAEQPCGRKPAAVACSRDGKRAAVSNLWSGTVTFLEVDGPDVKALAHCNVGPFPRGLTFAPRGNSLYVAVAGNDEVVQVDWDSQKVIRRWPAPTEPRHVILSEDGRCLAVASSRSGQVRCWNTGTGQPHWERKIEDGFNLRGLAFTPDHQGLVCAHVVRREFPVTKENIEQGWVIDSRLTRFPLRAEEVISSQQIALDTRGRAVGDPHGLSLSADGHWLAVTGSGTHELLLIESAAITWNSGDPGDFVDPQLLAGPGKFRRVPLGGRPLTVSFWEKSDEVAVANYLLDAVQIVDAKAGRLLRTIPLGPPQQPSPARKGEVLFYDAQRSHNQWFSCHTCHVEGHTCGLNFDTLNDDSYGNPKLTPTLRNVTKTGPWTWHGWQKDLGAGIEKSLTETMFGPKPTPEEIKALLAFLETLEHPPNPHRGRDGSLTASAQRGQTLFHGKARCVRCHHGENYTSESNYDVKLEPDGSPYARWNPPSLLGLFDRSPYLHDGRAKTLDDLLRKHHAPEHLGGQALTAQERLDLIEFLRSL